MRGKSWISFILGSVVFGFTVGMSHVSYGQSYLMRTYRLGVYDRVTPENSTMVPTTPTLAFEGLTLQEMLEEKFTLYANACGGSSVKKAVGLSPNGLLSYTNALQEIEFILAPIIWQDGKYMKTVVVKLTDGTGGVFAQAVTARHATSSSYTYQFINLNREDGTVTYNGTEDAIADSYNAANYGLCGLSTSQFFPAATIDPDATIPSGRMRRGSLS